MKNLILLALLAAAIFGGIKFREWYSGDTASSEGTPVVEVPPRLVRELSNSLIFVEGNAGKGSGFICAFGSAKFVITNQHVVAGNPGVKFTLLDQSPIRTGQAAAAVGHDIMSFALLSDAKAMEIMTSVETNAAIGDEVAVLGNGSGDRVIKPLGGKLIAIGPDRVEVSAQWVPGNSGSPIIHVKSGKVIGIATFHKLQKVDPLTGIPKDKPEVKHFGYRLDTVKQWQPVEWPEYTAEFNLLQKVETRTNDFMKLIPRLLSSKQFNAAAYEDPAIRSPLERFAKASHGQGLIKTDLLSAAKDLTNSLRIACDTDVTQALTQVRYDFFRHKLGDHQQIRQQLHKGFDELMKILSR